MNYEDIKEKTLFVYEECNIREFPIHCINILLHYGFKIFTYKQLKMKNKELYEMCVSFSGDAFCYKRIIAYDENKPYQRVRFSLMHELGHYILGHKGNSKKNEAEANFFASHILAPRIAIHYSNCKHQSDVSGLFGLSSLASQIAFDDYRRWHRGSIHGLSQLDEKMYYHFFQEHASTFVYQTNQCSRCGEEIINLSSKTCSKCLAKEIIQKNKFQYEPINDTAFHKAENHWLYGETH